VMISARAATGPATRLQRRMDKQAPETKELRRSAALALGPAPSLAPVLAPVQTTAAADAKEANDGAAAGRARAGRHGDADTGTAARAVRAPAPAAAAAAAAAAAVVAVARIGAASAVKGVMEAW
jgi:hypothetical protein